jgi:hypothetical protein
MERRADLGLNGDVGLENKLVRKWTLYLKNIRFYP